MWRLHTFYEVLSDALEKHYKEHIYGHIFEVKQYIFLLVSLVTVVGGLKEITCHLTNYQQVMLGGLMPDSYGEECLLYIYIIVLWIPRHKTVTFLI